MGSLSEESVAWENDNSVLFRCSAGQYKSRNKVHTIDELSLKDININHHRMIVTAKPAQHTIIHTTDHGITFESSSFIQSF
eukprot:scaffold142930_cov55-Attheya_sp.AAC.2